MHLPFDLSRLTDPAADAEIRVVRFMPDRLNPPTAERLFFVNTGSNSPVFAALADNALFQVVTAVTSSGKTHNGLKGVVVRVQFKSPDDVLGPVGVTICQAGITGNCAVTPLSPTT